MAKQVLRDLVEAMRKRQAEVQAEQLDEFAAVEAQREQDMDRMSWYQLDVEFQEEQDVDSMSFTQMEMDTPDEVAPIELYLSWNLPITLTDRIARLRKEIGRSGFLDCRQRHEALCQFATKHQTHTILCFSNDRTDLDAYGAGCKLLSTDDDEIGSIHYANLDQDPIHYQCKTKFADFGDPTLWDVCAGVDGSDRCYMAFETKEDADGFLAVAQPTLWEDATPEQLKRNYLLRNGYSQEEFEEYFK